MIQSDAAIGVTPAGHNTGRGDAPGDPPGTAGAADAAGQWLSRPADLAGQSIRGVVSTLTAEVLSYLLRVASIVTLARWLTPEHFGLIGMVTALTVFAERFKDLGLDVATVQRDEITHQQVSTLFWINLGVGAVIALVVAGSAPLIAAFYDEPRLVPITVLLSLTFLFGGAAIQHQALLRRQMQFGALARVTVASAAIGFAVSVLFASSGFGYWALVWREVSRTAAMSIGAWILCGWVPGLPRRARDVRSLMQAGGRISGFNALYFLSRSLDQILIGKVWGAGALGYYRQSHQLLMLPISLLHFPVDYVALPALSALQGQPEKFRQYYREITSILAFLCLPIVVFLAIFADDVIAVALGEQWLPAAPIFRVMAVAGLAWPVSATGGTVLLSSGRTGRYFWLGVANAATLALAFFIGIRWGSIGVAMAYAFWTYVTLVPFLLIAFHHTPVGIRDSIEAAGGSVIASLFTGIVLLRMSPLLEGFDHLLALAIAFSTGAAVYLLSSTFLPGGRRKIKEYVVHGCEAWRQAVAERREQLASQQS